MAFRMKKDEVVKAAHNGREIAPAAGALTPTGRLALLEENAGKGFEDVKSSDLTLPQFKLLQSMSAEAKRTETAYVRGAREGLWLDVITRRLFSEITFVPCKFATHYVEWTREARGQLIANHGTDDTLFRRCVKDEVTGEMVTPSGKSTITPTATWYGLVIGGNEIDPNVNDDDGEAVGLMSRAVITMASTAQKVSRRWISDAQSIQVQRDDGSYFKPSLYSMSYAIGSAPNQNNRGSWYLPVVTRAGWTLDYPNGEEIFVAAKAFGDFATEMHEQLIAASTANDVPEPAVNAASPHRASAPPADAPLDEDIPF